MARLRSRHLDRHHVWQHIFFVSYVQERTYILLRVALLYKYHLICLLLAVAPINVLAGGATDDCLRLYVSTAVVQNYVSSVMRRMRARYAVLFAPINVLAGGATDDCLRLYACTVVQHYVA